MMDQVSKKSKISSQIEPIPVRNYRCAKILVLVLFLLVTEMGLTRRNIAMNSTKSSDSNKKESGWHSVI